MFGGKIDAQEPLYFWRVAGSCACPFERNEALTVPGTLSSFSDVPWSHSSKSVAGTVRGSSTSADRPTETSGTAPTRVGSVAVDVRCVRPGVGIGRARRAELITETECARIERPPARPIESARAMRPVFLWWINLHLHLAIQTGCRLRSTRPTSRHHLRRSIMSHLSDAPRCSDASCVDVTAISSSPSASLGPVDGVLREVRHDLR